MINAPSRGRRFVSECCADGASHAFPQNLYLALYVNHSVHSHARNEIPIPKNQSLGFLTSP
jgi:hypothetical protein